MVLLEMVCERRSDANGQCVGWHSVGDREQQCAVAFKPEIMREHGSKGFDEPGLAVKVHCVEVRVLLLPIDPHRTATAVLGDICGLTPLECLLDLSDTGRCGGSSEDQFPKCEQLTTRRWRISGKLRCDAGVLDRGHFWLPTKILVAQGWK